MCIVSLYLIFRGIRRFSPGYASANTRTSRHILIGSCLNQRLRKYALLFRPFPLPCMSK